MVKQYLIKLSKENYFKLREKREAAIKKNEDTTIDFDDIVGELLQ